MKDRLTYTFVKDFIEKEGYKLLSSNYQKAKAPIEVKCPNGHSFTTSWDAFKGSPSQKGRRCPKCSKRRVDLSDVVHYAKTRGYKLLSNEYSNAKSKLQFECSEGHLFQMTWDNFKNNQRCCPECQGLRRWTIEEVRNYFHSRGFLLLTARYINVSQELRYRCPVGHISKTSFNKFKNEEHGCDYCGGSKKLEYIDVKNAFEKAGLTLLEKEYKNAGTRMKFRCSCGNIDKVDFRHFQWASKGRNPKRKCSKCMTPAWHYTLNEEERIKERKYPKYYAWVKRVKERDNFSCTICSYKGKDVDAHHLDGYSWCREKRTDVDNGVTLCTDCHGEFHSVYGFRDNTKSQYIEFMKRKFKSTS
jgi:hypothetical protein